ncbi:MAG: UDP-N-acetyl-D-mannosamine dehydrogenase [Chitinophagales bacterium]|nr:UDP-N-acetyl-D-mannosamine dehydrogenase [Chitinophagales bacterium]
MERKEVICVIGLGYIGLPTAALLANRGYKVIGVDVIADVVDTINNGDVHIAEPELDTFVHSAVQSGQLKAQLEVPEADVFMIAVPTPIREDKNPDISYVMEATKAIAPHVKEGNLIILESTSPVGTTEEVGGVLKSEGVDIEKLHIAYCPERVLPGKTMRELVENDRIVGGLKAEDSEKVKEFYSTFVQGEILVTNARTAEMSKLTENAYRDTSIAFANELSIICDDIGVDVWDLIKLANHHPRVNILQPGSGVGGHCIAVDPWFIVSKSGDLATLIKTSRIINDYKPEWVISKIEQEAEKIAAKGKKAKIACMGLAFKPDIDDLRESPSLQITKALRDRGFDILPVEPNIKAYKDWNITDYKTALKEADIIAYLVAHREFRSVSESDTQVVLDFCGIKK